MKIKEIQFKESSSKRVYDNYMNRIQKTVRSLPKIDQKEVLLEFNSHIYEGLARKNQESEIDRLLDVIDKLGDPEEVLQPLIADKKLEQATRTFNPVHLFKALILNITNGISYIIFFILYLSLFGFVFLIYAKITNPEEVGLFFENEQFLVLGKINPEYLANTTYKEVLGNWFIPVMICSILLFYLLITLLLKFKRSINKN
jgi:hypothetical protein